jgi:hypothetical protein
MNHCQIAQFAAHQNDPLGGLIEAKTRGRWSHSTYYVGINSATGKHRIYEQYAPHARFRDLENSELPGIYIFSIKDWTDEQDATLRALQQSRADQKIPYWVDGLLRFSALDRAIEGEATDQDWYKHAFCSMEVFRCALECGTRLLTAHDYEVSPVILGYSTLLLPEPQLTVINFPCGTGLNSSLAAA